MEVRLLSQNRCSRYCLLCFQDHMANVLPWQAKASHMYVLPAVTISVWLLYQATHTGARLVMSLRRENVDPTATLLDHITSRTAVVAAAPCGWTDGAKVDLGAVWSEFIYYSVPFSIGLSSILCSRFSDQSKVPRAQCSPRRGRNAMHWCTAIRHSETWS